MKISQREARRLKKLVAELQRAENVRREFWSRDYPGGIHVATVTCTDDSDPLLVATKTARKLNHAVVAVNSGREVFLYALPVAKAE